MAQALDLLIIDFLLGVVAHGGHCILGSSNRPRLFRRDIQLIVRGGHCPDDRLSILQTQVQRLGRHHAAHGVPLHVHSAREFRFDEESLGVRFDDTSRQPVSILERYLVSHYAHREETRHPCNTHASAHNSSPLFEFYFRHWTGPSLEGGQD